MLHENIPPLPMQARDWAKRNLFPRYIFFDSKYSDHGFCTECEQYVPLMDEPEHRKKTICPVCGEATMVGSWYGRKWMRQHAVCLVIQPWGKGLLLRECGCWADFESGQFEPHWYDDDVTLFESGTYIRESCHDWRGWMPVKRLKRQAGSRQVMFDDMTGTEFENCPVKTFVNLVGDHPARFIRFYQRRPGIEHLVRAYLDEVVKDILTGVGGINWKGRRPRDMLGLNKTEVRAVCTARLSLRAVNLYKRYPGLFDLWEDRNLLKGITNGSLRWIETEKDIPKAVRYLQRCVRRGIREYNVHHLLTDTRRMLRDLGHEMTEHNLWPPNLQKAHDDAMAEIRAIERAKRAEEWEKEQDIWDRIAGKLSPLCWESDGLTIRPVKSRMELVREGDCLDHCVATYAEQLKAERSYILLIRRAEKPDEPYFTLNLSTSGTIIQCHGYKNDRFLPGGTRPQEIKDFEQRWLKAKVEPWMKKRRLAVPKSAS